MSPLKRNLNGITNYPPFMTDLCFFTTYLANRVAFSLPTQQDEYTSCNGEDRQDCAEASNAQKLDDTPSDEKDG